MRVIDLALKDLLQIVRDWKSALFLLVMPILFTLFFGFIFGSSGAGDDPRLPVGFVDHDGASALSTSLQDLMETSDAIRLVILEGDEADRAADLVRDEDLAAVVIVPSGVGADLASAPPASALTLIVDQNAPAGQTAIYAVQAAVMRLLGAVETAQLSAETYEAKKGFEDETARQAYLNETLALATTAWGQPPLTVTVEQSGAPAENEEDAPINAFLQSSPGMIVQFAIFGLNTSAMVLVLERKSRTLQCSSSSLSSKHCSSSSANWPLAWTICASPWPRSW
jgi:ABC-type Na+ efflux pump permease subunit